MTIPRARLFAVAALVVVTAVPFIGRAVISSDGAEVVGEALGVVVNGDFSFGRTPLPPGDAMVTGAPFHSMYGLFPSLLPLTFLAPSWPFRLALGAPLLDAVVSLTWWLGTFAAGLAFLALARTFSPGASPGRSLFIYAPLCLVGLVAARRLSAPALALCVLTPAVHLLVVARWWT